jgi:hypothetical protein
MSFTLASDGCIADSMRAGTPADRYTIHSSFTLRVDDGIAFSAALMSLNIVV